MFSRILPTILLAIAAITSSAQVENSMPSSLKKNIPKAPTVEPLFKAPTFNIPTNDPVLETTKPNTNFGVSDRIREQNRKLIEDMGYTLPPTNEEINQRTQGTQNNKPFELPPNLQQINEIEREIAILNRVSRTDQMLQQKGFYQSTDYKNSVIAYNTAYNRLLAMLEGRQEISLKDAFYEMEGAFGNLHLSYEEYSNRIEQSANFIRAMILEAGLDPNNQDDLHWGIQHFMGDTVTIQISNPDLVGGFGTKKTHLPFIYDYVDNFKLTDFRDYFVTKTLATGSGQCHTLPSVYLLLAEALGADAYLSFAPQHSFIKYHSEGTIMNYEPTVDWHFTDQDYLKERPTMAKAVKNGFFMNKMSKEEIVATLMIELGHSFRARNYMGDGSYIKKTVSTGAKYLNNGRANEQAQVLMSELYALEFDRLFRANRLGSMEEIKNHPEVQRAFDRFRLQQKTYRELGLQDAPEEMYLKILEKYDKREKLQLAKGIDTKSKKDLFVQH